MTREQGIEDGKIRNAPRWSGREYMEGFREGQQQAVRGYNNRIEEALEEFDESENGYDYGYDDYDDDF